MGGLARLSDRIRERADAALIDEPIVLTTRSESGRPWARVAPAAAAQLGIDRLALVVVRPDGHVGLRADRDHLDSLAAYQRLLASGGRRR
jgi:hypothetical protein